MRAVFLEEAEPAPEVSARAKAELVQALAEDVRARLPDLEPTWEPQERPALPAPSNDDSAWARMRR